MSNNLRQAAQQALEALENAYMVNSWAWVDQKKQVITALQAALSEPEQPVAWNPIETAPKDRTVLVCGRHATMPRMAKWNAQYEWFESFEGVHLYDLTHWMLLPPVPVTHGIGEQHE